jgi:hypothetical protein
MMRDAKQTNTLINAAICNWNFQVVDIILVGGERNHHEDSHHEQPHECRSSGQPTYDDVWFARDNRRSLQMWQLIGMLMAGRGVYRSREDEEMLPDGDLM